jgi:hypothetical protein
MKPIETDLPPMVEIRLSKTKDKNFWMVHLINQTGHFGNSFYSPVTTVKGMCVVPFYIELISVKSLISDKIVGFLYEKNNLHLDIENLSIVDIFHIQTRS